MPLRPSTLRLAYLAHFYASTLWVTMPCALIMGYIKYLNSFLTDGIRVGLIVYASFGLLLDMVARRLFRAGDTLFYANGGWRISTLYATTWALSATLCLTIHFILKCLWTWY